MRLFCRFHVLCDASAHDWELPDYCFCRNISFKNYKLPHYIGPGSTEMRNYSQTKDEISLYACIHTLFKRRRNKK